MQNCRDGRTYLRRIAALLIEISFAVYFFLG
jgi:hypothetical protein